MALTGFRHTLEWSEFQEVRRRPSGVHENAQITLLAASNPVVEGNGRAARLVDLNTAISIDRSQTWVVRGEQTVDLLMHEQVHFDIQAIGARELHNNVLTLVGSNGSEYTRRSASMEREIQAKIVRKNNRYDVQTSHGNNLSQQQMWEARIRVVMDNPNGSLDSLP